MSKPHAPPDAVIETYRKRAARYDFTANLYYLIGFREVAYRKRAVGALGLRPGDTVVEIGCGTGLNFRLLRQAVGPRGKIIGVDLTDAMLAQAKRRVEGAGWENVELVHADAADYAFPTAVDGILSTFALSLSPRCGQVIESGSEALSPGRRWVILDIKMPPSPLSRLAPLFMPLVRPFAVTEELAAERLWEVAWDAMYRCLGRVRIDEWYAGVIYVASGQRT